MEIKVVLQDALAASDLTWFLDASARVSKSADGVFVVSIQVGENVRHVQNEIRKWLVANRVGPAVIHLGDEIHTVPAAP